MPKFGDRVQETTTTTSTGTITLAGAVLQFQAFATAFNVGDYLAYAIIGQGTAEWEIGKGFLLTSNTLSRDTIRSSSNAGALVNFSAGTKSVFCTPSAEHVDNGNIGLQLAQGNNWGMP